jgi:RND family efflux transporter MFP subunit
MKNRIYETLRFGAALVVMAGAVVGCSKGETASQPLTPVKTYELKTTQAEASARYSGSIEPETQVDVTFKRSGKVISVNVDEGDLVRKGAVLAVLEQEDFAVKVAAADGQLQEAAASLKKADADYQRAKALFAEQSMTKPDYDSAVAQYEMGQAKQASARAQLEEARNAENDATLRAPLDGVVLHRNVEIGTLASTAKAAFVVADVSAMKAVFGVNDATVQKLTLGMPLPIFTESLPGKAFSGKITSISPAADPASRVFDLEVTVQNQDRSLKSGMIATMGIANETEHATKLLIPFESIVAQKSNYGVYRLVNRSPHSIAQLQIVTLGDVYGNQVEVKSGLNSGDRIVTQGSALLINGQEVKVED